MPAKGKGRVERKEAEDAEVVTRTISAVSTPIAAQAFETRRQLRGAYWQLCAKKTLDLLELVCPTDRSFQSARRIALDFINDAETQLMHVVTAGFAELANQEKENANG